MTLKMLLICLPLAAGLGCGDNLNGVGKDAGTHVDSSVPKDGSGSGSNIIPPDASCFDLSTITSPTNNQIINACTDSDKIFKDSHPPLLGSDGSLPPLP